MDRYRNHPSVVIQWTVPILLFLAILFVNISKETKATFALAVVTLILLAMIGYSALIWRKTWVSFEDTEIVVLRDTAVTKTLKRIQYTRLGSVGVRRGIVNRLFGTTTLIFNVNSSVNGSQPEATLTLRNDIAEAIRDDLNARIFSKASDVSDELSVESMVTVGNAEILFHALISQPTSRLITSLLMLAYSVVSAVYGSAGGVFLALFLLVLIEVVPLVREILTYCNYRLYRIGDTVTVESGLIATTRRSFKVEKVNTVRIRRPLLARLLGMSTLEAEVVGLGSGDGGSMVPLLCPLKKDAEVVELMGKLMPEVVFESEPVRQSGGAMRAMSISYALVSIIVLAVCGVIACMEWGRIQDADVFPKALAVASLIAIAVGVPLILAGRIVLAQRNRGFDMGGESFLLEYGGYDVTSEFILYDKVQRTEVSAGPIQRRFGSAILQTAVMSSAGSRIISSGLFPPEELERVSAEVMLRIRDGRYDPRRYE